MKDLRLFQIYLGLCAITVIAKSWAFELRQQTRTRAPRLLQRRASFPLCAMKDSEAEQEEEVRIKIITARRKQIRQTLKAADNLRLFRLEKGFVPELDEDGKPINSDEKLAVSFTAFALAVGAITLRVGGRAALVSAIGLDFVTKDPSLKENLDLVLTTADNMDPATKALIFTGCWTAVKVVCFDAAGVALALASGILFGGVLQGALASAAAATFGSSVAFGLAKLDTPIRKKGLELIEEYPSLRGIEKVVAEEGLKAVLTLRLAPVLPFIPIGAYNYIYSITNVSFLDFSGGIFLGSLKPYLLDSYLGYFGKSLVDGTADSTGWQDILLLVVLGVSVLIGVFASQLAAETWESVIQEMENDESKPETAEEEDASRQFLGFDLPDWVITFQDNMILADERVKVMVLDEYDAKAWNQTKADGFAEPNPSFYQKSPEVTGRNKGLDIASDLCDGLVLSPILFGAFGKYADPLFVEKEDDELKKRARQREIEESPQLQELEVLREDLLAQTMDIQEKVERRIEVLEDRIRTQEQSE